MRVAARRAAVAEDRAVFHGFNSAGITGITEASPHDPVMIGNDYVTHPSFVASATAKLKLAGGTISFAPGVNGAVVISQHSGDIELVLGQDSSLGYSTHELESVELHLEEGFTVKVCAPEAAAHLTYAE